MRRPFRFLQGRVFPALIKAVFSPVIDDHLISLFGGLFSLRFVQILPHGDQNVDALFDLGPFQELFMVAGVFPELDASGVVVQKAAAAILKCPAAAPGTVLFFQEFDALFLRVVFGVVGRDAYFAVLEAAAGCQSRSPIRLGKRKSGDFFSLRSLVDLCDLLRLGEEETQL